MSIRKATCGDGRELNGLVAYDGHPSAIRPNALLNQVETDACEKYSPADYAQKQLDEQSVRGKRFTN